MPAANKRSEKHNFLQRGGEMGELTRAYDWSNTSLGSPEHWPQSLRTVVSVILHSDFPMFLWWGEEMIQFYNDAYRPSLGQDGKHPRALGQNGKDCWPEIWNIIYPLIDKVRNTGESFFAEDQLIPIFRNGKIEDVYWTFSYSAVIGESGSVDGVLVVCHETTKQVNTVAELTRTQGQLVESQRKYKTLISESPIATGLYIGEELRIQFANKILTDFWGKDLSVVGMRLEDAVPELRGQPFLDLLLNVYRTGNTYIGTNEKAYLSVGGELKEFYFDFIYKALRDSQGVIYGIHHTAVDVTKTVVAQRKLIQSEANLTNIILQSPVAMCLLKGPGLVVDVLNSKILEIWGKAYDEVINKPLFQALPEARSQGLEEILDSVYRTGQRFVAHERPVLLLSKGKLETKYLDFVYEALLEGDQGQPTGVLAVAIEVTDQVKARLKIEEVVAERTAELAESNKNLKRTNDELAQFAYIASHDLQEPARKISTFTEMLRRSLDRIEPRTENLLEKIERASIRMLSLIRDVLAVSQLAKGDQAYVQIDLNTVVTSALEDFELFIEEKQAAIYKEQLPVIEGIAIQMNQLFNNLLSNALKFNVKGRKPEIHIRTNQLSPKEVSDRRLHPHKIYHRISVIDNGIGFRQENSGQIFDIFQRLHAKEDYHGTGIGLAMCRKICQNHNGDIYATSTPGEGAAFHVILPISQ